MIKASDPQPLKSNVPASLESRLRAHPQLCQRVEALLEIAEDRSGNLDRADEAEARLVEELRRLGQEVLQDWAIGKEAQKAWAFSEEGAQVHSKKNSAGIRPLGPSS
jgi:hypothetical protein